MLKFIRLHGQNIDLDVIRGYSDDELEDAYFDLKSEQINVNGRLTDLRLDDNYDRVRESGLMSASRHIALGIEFIASLRRARRPRVAEAFMTRARETLAPEVFNDILSASRG